MVDLQRRRFLQGLGGVAAAAAWPRFASGQVPLALAKGRVVEVEAPGLVAADGVVAPGPAARAVDRALSFLTGDADPVAAMARFVTPEDSVGLKLDCMGCARVVPHRALTARVIQLVKAVGVPPDKIVVWDQFSERLVRAGYPADGMLEGVKVLHHRSQGWTPTGAIGGERFTPLLTRFSALINLHAAKDHRYCGVSGALVNATLGSILDASSMHGGLNAAIPRLYRKPDISGRVRLNLCDAAYVLRQGGPQDHSAHRVRRNAVLASVDPVAMDWAVIELVEIARKRGKLKSLYTVDTPRRRPPRHVEIAAEMGLGVPMHELAWERLTAADERLPVVPVRLRVSPAPT